MSWLEAGRILKEWRDKQVPQMRQADLGEKVGVSNLTIGRIERAKDAAPPTTKRPTLTAIGLLMGPTTGRKFLDELGIDPPDDAWRPTQLSPSRAQVAEVLTRHILAALDELGIE